MCNNSRVRILFRLVTFASSLLFFDSGAGAGAGDDVASGLAGVGLGAATAAGAAAGAGFSAAGAAGGGASLFACAGAAAGASGLASGAFASSGFFSTFFLSVNFGASDAVGKRAFMVASLSGTRFFFSFRNQLLRFPTYFKELIIQKNVLALF